MHLTMAERGSKARAQNVTGVCFAAAPGTAGQ